MWVALCGASLQYLLVPFGWSSCLLLYLRIFSNNLRENAKKQHKIAWHLTPLAVFLSHFLHNELFINRAEFLDPNYIRAWLLVMPGYPNVPDYLLHFSSTKKERYEVEQIGEARLAQFPWNFLHTFKRQLFLVTVVYVIPKINLWVTALQSLPNNFVNATNFVVTQIYRIVCSSALLSFLPYVITEFPCFLDSLNKFLFKMERSNSIILPPKRQTISHVLISSMLSTYCFLLERNKRLNALVIYTWWRIIEAYVGVALKLYGASKSEKVALSSIFMGLVIAEI